jgi:flagellar basal-body rod protein FlgG
MANGLQIAASGLIAQEWRLDSIANDIANVSTAGYEQSRTAFAEVLGSSGGVRYVDAGKSSAQSSLASSDNPISVGIVGPGFIQVRAAGGGVALTRNGDLQIDGEHNLALADGPKVDPPITIPADVDPEDISIASDGTVTAQGKKLGRLTLVDVPAADALAVVGGGLLTPTAASGAARPATAATVQQGVLEQSNVDLASALSEMMDAQRTYQLASRALHTQDQLLEIANGIRR